MADSRVFNLMRGIRSSNLLIVFNRGEAHALGRILLILSSVASNIASVLFNGTFYTGFLLANGIDIVQIGVIGFIPYLCSLLSLLSPALLTRFPRRKTLLVGMRACYYFFLIIGITVLPYLPITQGVKIVLLSLFLFIAHGCNAISTTGWFVWHKKLLPDNVRGSYFSYSLAITGCVNALALLLGSFLADALKASGQELTGMVIIRCCALLFAAADLLCLARIKEFPYEASGKPARLADTFIYPIRARRYLATMSLQMTRNLMIYLTSAFTSVFLLETVGISYTFINAMAAIYAFFLIFLTPFWKRLYNRLGLFRALALSVVCTAPFYAAYAFIDPGNCAWLYPLVIVGFHVFNVGINIGFAQIPYVNMPDTHEESFSSFQIITNNCTAFLGQMLGTAFIAVVGERVITLGAFTLGSVQMMLLAQSGLMLVFALIVHLLRPRLEPRD